MYWRQTGRPLLTGSCGSAEGVDSGVLDMASWAATPGSVPELLSAAGRDKGVGMVVVDR
jgi:hypothetical protein